MTSTYGSEDFLRAMRGATLLAYPTGATMCSQTLASRATDELARSLDSAMEATAPTTEADATE